MKKKKIFFSKWKILKEFLPSARWNWEEQQPRVQSVLAHFINKEGWYGSVLTLVVSYNLVTNRVSGIKKTKEKQQPGHLSM